MHVYLCCVFQLCRHDQIDVRITTTQIIDVITERALVLEHYQQSLSFKIQTFRMFHRREADDYHSTSEALSTSTEITNQMATIGSLRSLVSDIYDFIKRLERILFIKMQLENLPHSSRQH